MKGTSVILSCEHAGNKIPEDYKQYFLECEKRINSHEGFDEGAFDCAAYLSENLGVPVFYTMISRLLVDCNRSVGNANLFSDRIKGLDAQVRKKILEEFYFPYRLEVEKNINRAVTIGNCLHFSVHTFTPFWSGFERKVDIGILFDESRSREYEFSEYLRNCLQSKLPDMNIQFNEPYLGTDDGFTSYFRKKMSDEKYGGIELEINQKWVNTDYFSEILSSIADCLDRY